MPIRPFIGRPLRTTERPSSAGNEAIRARDAIYEQMRDLPLGSKVKLEVVDD